MVNNMKKSGEGIWEDMEGKKGMGQFVIIL